MTLWYTFVLLVILFYTRLKIMNSVASRFMVHGQLYYCKNKFESSIGQNKNVYTEFTDRGF